MKTSLALVITMFSFSAYATDLGSASAIQNKTNQSSIHSQKVINSSVQKSEEFNEDIRQLNEELRNLTIYKKHLKGLITNQADEIESLDHQISSIKETRQGIVPLMYNMLDELQTLIENDKPIKYKQRIKRIQELRSLMTQADVSEAEKYRQILEAYQIEFQYGNKMATYRSEISLKGNHPHKLLADIFYLGRAVFVARSIDKSKFWTWDQHQQQWIDGNSKYLEKINQAYELANQKIAPTMLLLPVSLNTAEVK
ncbi:DUF3450 domain-containing protein [Vibrio salinus]|uniref:DUF3450 domain-containing protein n=1 Tax=Vibrio salinus TaxID=2899784 RepID=UPI001E5AB690|nr:DUF3450 domain-containing protein [Vibrio salinus]MCE0492509.1 DUF3450 domain-containing protein [Vibrio salinus]